MDILVLVIVFAVLVEALIEYAKTVAKAFVGGEYKTAITQVVAIVLGIVICFAGNADVFAALGITFSIKYMGVVLTGIFISRGANYMSDLVKRIQSLIGSSVGTLVSDVEYLGSGEPNEGEK